MGVNGVEILVDDGWGVRGDRMEVGRDGRRRDGEEKDGRVKRREERR